MARVFLTLILTFVICIAQDSAAQERREVCFEGIPEGTYALSVCDTVARMEGATINDGLKPYSPFEIDSIRKAYPKLYFGYETEQVISGRVKGTFGKVKKPQLHIFVPKTGFRDTYDMEGKQRFHLRDMDFVDGTEYVLQVTRPKGSHGFLQLYVDDTLFPVVSVKKYDKELPDSIFIASEGMQEYARKMEEYMKMIELPEIQVKGKKITSMRFGGISPGKGYGVNDPMLAKGYTMEYLMMKLGLQIGMKGNYKVPYLWKFVKGGWGVKVEQVVPTIFIDDFILEADEMDELWNIQSEFVKQIEYYLPEESEGNLVLKGNEAGALYIYTKVRPDFGNTLSMVTVRQIGYQPERTFHSSCDHGATVLWNPSLKVGEDGKANVAFEAKEGKRYKVILEGISDKGDMVRKEATL